MNPKEMKPAQYFRAGAGAVILNGRGLVLALERADVPGAWQLPQGGLQRGETPLQAVYREVQEETGIAQNNLDLLDASPAPLAYELPDGLRSERTGRGQVLYWFLFKFLGRDSELRIPPRDEFQSFSWVSWPWLAEETAAFRKQVYNQLGSRWHGYLS